MQVVPDIRHETSFWEEDVLQVVPEQVGETCSQDVPFMLQEGDVFVVFVTHFPVAGSHLVLVAVHLLL
tara:strand:- start:6312 stop:6515 length:204 start_codon:yes stop_codon:yes gene_type:complete